MRGAIGEPVNLGSILDLFYQRLLWCWLDYQNLLWEDPTRLWMVASIIFVLDLPTTLELQKTPMRDLDHVGPPMRRQAKGIRSNTAART